MPANSKAKCEDLYFGNIYNLLRWGCNGEDKFPYAIKYHKYT